MTTPDTNRAALEHALDLARRQVATLESALGISVHSPQKGSEPLKDLLTIKEAKEVFRRSEKQVRRWAKDHGLGEMIGFRWYLRRSAVTAYLATRAGHDV